MAKIYAWEEAIIRIYRKLRGDTISANVEELDGSLSSANEALAGIAEILQESGSENLHLFPPILFHPVSSAPTGTALSYLGGALYAIDGSLMWYGSSGTITTIAGS
jgi:hypothetical protein